MSLFTDLKEVFTAYAQRIKGLAAADEEIKADLGDLTELETEEKTDLVSAINEAAQSGLSSDVKNAILACFRNTMMIDSAQGAAAYDDLYNLFYGGDEPIEPTEPVKATDVMSMFGFTLSGISSAGAISFSAMNNGSAFVFAPNVTHVKGTLTYSTSGYDYGRLFIFRTVSDTVLYGILSKNLVKLTLNKTTEVYSVTTDASIAELTTSDSNKRASSYVELRLSNGVLTGYDENGNVDFTVTNANCIGFWGNNTTGTPSAALERNAINTRAMTIEDVESSHGFTGLSVTNGVVSAESQKTFSALILSVTSIRSKYTQHDNNGVATLNNMLVYKKQQDGTFKATNGNSLYTLTYDSTNDKYSASSVTDTDVKVKGQGRTVEQFNVTIVDNTLYCFTARNGLLLMIENANCIGIYSATTSPMVKFNVEVQENA